MDPKDAKSFQELVSIRNNTSTVLQSLQKEVDFFIEDSSKDLETKRIQFCELVTKAKTDLNRKNTKTKWKKKSVNSLNFLK